MRRFGLQLTLACCLGHVLACAGGPDDDDNGLRPKIGGPISDFPVRGPVGFDGGPPPLVVDPGETGGTGGVGGTAAGGGGTLGSGSYSPGSPGLDAGLVPAPADPVMSTADAESAADRDAGCGEADAADQS